MDLRQYTKGKEEQIKSVRKKIVFKAYSSIVQKTPVDTGRARGNWIVSVGEESFSSDDKSRHPRYTSEGDIGDAKDDESYFIENNLPYIVSLEYGHSKQAPEGMVGLTMANMGNIVNSAIEESGFDK